MSMAIDSILHGKPQEARPVCEGDDAVAVVTELLAQMLDAVAQLSQHPVEDTGSSPESSKRTSKGGAAAGDNRPSGASRTSAQEASSVNPPSTATCSQDAESNDSSRPGARPKPYIPWSQREIYERRRNGSVSSSVNMSAAWDRPRAAGGNPARKSVSATGESLAAASGLPAAPRGNRRTTGSPSPSTGLDGADEPHSTSRSAHTSAPLGVTHSPGTATKPAAASGRDALRMAREQQHGPRPHPNFSPRSPNLAPPSTYTTAASPPPPSRTSPGPGSYHATPNSMTRGSPGAAALPLACRSPAGSRKAMQATSTGYSPPGSERNSGSHVGRSGRVSGPVDDGATVTTGAAAAAAGGRSRSGSGLTGGKQQGVGRSAGVKGGRSSGSGRGSGRSSGNGGPSTAVANGVGGGDNGLGAGETGRAGPGRGGVEGGDAGRWGRDGDGNAAGAGTAHGQGADADVRDVEVEVVQQGSRSAGGAGGGTAAGASLKGKAAAGVEVGQGSGKGLGGRGVVGEQRDAGVEGEGADGPTPACCKCAIM